MIDCLGGRKRRGRKLLNRRSARTAACPAVTVRYPGLLSDRAHSRHGIAPLLDDCCTLQGMARVPIRAGYRLALGFWPEGGAEAPRSRVAAGHFRRKREAPLTVEGHPRTLSGPSPDPWPYHGSALSRRLRSRAPGGHCQAGRPRQFLSTRCIVLPSGFADEGEKGGAEHVRAVYRPGTPGYLAGARRSQDAEPRLHRHRAHPARPHP